jgi:hypothetical protein
VASTPPPTAFRLWIASMRPREAFRAPGASRRDPNPVPPQCCSAFNLLGAPAASTYDLLCHAVG